MDKRRTEKNQGSQDNEDGKRFAEYSFQGTDYTPFNFIDVIAHAADQVAFTLFCKKSERKVQNFCEKVCPQTVSTRGCASDPEFYRIDKEKSS